MKPRDISSRLYTFNLDKNCDVLKTKVYIFTRSIKLSIVDFLKFYVKG